MPFSGLSCGWILAGAFLSLGSLTANLFAADVDLERTRNHFLSGRYSDCVRECREAIADKLSNEEWSLLLGRSLLAQGQYPEAKTNILEAIEHNRGSIRIRLLAYTVLEANGDRIESRRQLGEINDLGGSRIWNYRDPVNLAALGQAALLLDADPKLVLERFLDAARKADPLCREAWSASGELALQKQDYALAANLYSEAAQHFPQDPDFQYGLACAYQPSDRPHAIKCIQAALQLNPRHTPALVLWAELAVDSEDYSAADELLDKALAVNPWLPDAWACRAVLRELQDDPRGAAQARANALHFWDTNPNVDHLIGRKLSQNYRFKEGAACQRQALSFDPAFLPARLQLAQDLLRLGDEPEGWALAREVRENDAYDVTAFNLDTLHETLSKFATLTNDHFIVRMSPHEAEMYGSRVLTLLERARSRLTDKYRVELERPTTIEIFPEQKDFGVRTFGMPHNPGFLGVCFGPVITANSPASQSETSNWEAVLWHEFTHVITLQITRNKMPRWLSEGLSVYEEELANPGWGQHMNPRYREMILGGELTPVGELSGAFLAPKTPMHLQFAYYEASLVADYLVDQFGWDTVLTILHDLGEGQTINASLSSRTLPIEQLETNFESHARQLALNLAPGLDWELPPGTAPPGTPRQIRQTTDDPLPPHPPITPSPPTIQAWTADRLATNFWVLRQKAETAVAGGKWTEAKKDLNLLVREYPEQRGPDNALALLAEVHRSLDETDLERAALERWAALDADAPDAYQRLMAICKSAQDWEGVILNANRYLAVNPILAQPYLFLAQANEKLDRPEAAIQAWQKVLLAGPADPTEAHFRLAELLHQQGDPGAKRHVLEALERAPRFREAHRLLLDLQADTEPQPQSDRRDRFW